MFIALRELLWWQDDPQTDFAENRDRTFAGHGKACHEEAIIAVLERKAGQLTMAAQIDLFKVTALVPHSSCYNLVA